jgi:hypothetical protein
MQITLRERSIICQFNIRRNRFKFRKRTNVVNNTTNGSNYTLTLANRKRYGCETWSVTLEEEHRLRVFENRILRKILGPKRDGVTGYWRKMHSKKLHGLYLHPILIG